MTTDAELARSLEGDFTSRYAEVNGVRLHYVAGGQGDPLILLGGWPQTWWQFHKIMPALARHRRVIAVDLRGMGGSDKPADGYDKKTMARDILGLARHLGHSTVDIAGHDIGASLAYHFAANHPEATRKVVMMDMGLPDESWYEQAMLPRLGGQVESMARGRIEPGAYTWWYAFNQLRGLPEILLAGRTRPLIDWLFGYMLADQASIDEHDREVYARAYDSPDAIRASNGWYQTMPQDIADEKTYGPLAAPLLVLSGEGAYALQKQQMEGKGRQVRVVKVEGSGHYVPDERPQTVIREMAAFLD